MRKTLTFHKYGMSFEVKIFLDDDNQKLSVFGTLFDQNGDSVASGQVSEVARLFAPAQLCDTWERWHLNTMRAGTPAQEELIKFESKRRRALDLSQMS
jgi:hypothetical protein